MQVVRFESNVIVFVALLLMFAPVIFAKGEISLENPRELYQLTGMWRFSRADHPEFKQTDYDDSSWEWLSVPGYWTALGVKDTEVGWYRFRFKLSPSFRYIPISILAPAIADTHEFFVNGKRVGGFGKISPEGVILAKENHPAIVEIPLNILNKEGYNVIALRVGDNVGWGGIIGSEFYIGNTELVELKYKRNNIWNLSVVIILVFLSIYSASLYFYLSRESNFLYFSFLAIIMGVTLLGFFHHAYWIIDSYWFNHFAFHTGLNTGMAIAFRFVYSFFDRKPDRMLKFVTYLSILLFTVLLLTPLHLSVTRFYANITLNIALLLGIAGFFFLVYVILKSIWLKKPGSLISGFGSIVILICFFTEILYYLFAVDFLRFALEGTIIYMVCISYGLFLKH